MSHPSIILRRAQVGEAEVLAKLHVSVWRETYRDYAPDKAIQTLDETRRLPYWAQATVSEGVWVADDGGEVLGVISFGPSQHEAFGGRVEIKHLYVALNAQGQGVGRRLLEKALELCAPGGVALAVVRQNTTARSFYARLGGVECGAFSDPGPLWLSENIVVAWD